jgi:hypothetical protein
MDLVRQVEAKYPALLFKQQLTAFVEGLYGMIRDNVKKEISSVVSLVIQVTPSIESHAQVKYQFIFLIVPAGFFLTGNFDQYFFLENIVIVFF